MCHKSQAISQRKQGRALLRKWESGGIKAQASSIHKGVICHAWIEKICNNLKVPLQETSKRSIVCGHRLLFLSSNPGNFPTSKEIADARPKQR
jgi:hypothetical protein